MVNELIIDENVMSRVIENNEVAPIRLCDEHENRLQGELRARPDLLLTCFHLITTLACNAMGTQNVIRHTCPVCAFQKFDFIGELSVVLLNLPEKKHG